MTVNDFLKKYHRQAVYCNSFYIQFYSYLKNEMDIEFKCKLFKDERGTDMNILYKYSSCKIKNFSIKSFFTCYPQGNKEEIFITLSIYLNPKGFSDAYESTLENRENINSVDDIVL